MNDLEPRRRKRFVGRVLVPVNWWDIDGTTDCCIAAYQPRGASSYATALTNLANPGTYDLAEGVAPYWSADKGFMFRMDLNSYLRTGIIPDRDYTALVRYEGWDGVGLGDFFGEYDGAGTANFGVWINTGGEMTFAWGSDGYNDMGVIAPQIGVIGLAGDQPYLNGKTLAGPMEEIADWSGTPLEIYLGCSNWMGVPDYNQDTNVTAFAIWGCTLTPAQVAQVTGYMMLL